MTARRLPDLDTASLAAARDVIHLVGIRRNASTLQLRNSVHLAIREAMRAVLPEGDPRRDPAYPFEGETP